MTFNILYFCLDTRIFQELLRTNKMQILFIYNLTLAKACTKTDVFTKKISLNFSRATLSNEDYG